MIPMPSPTPRAVKLIADALVCLLLDVLEESSGLAVVGSLGTVVDVGDATAVEAGTSAAAVEPSLPATGLVEVAGKAVDVRVELEVPASLILK